MVALSAMAHAGATIVIINNNAPGVGFNDPTAATPVGGNSGTTIGAQRLIAFQFAADIWGAALDSTVEIRIQAQFIALSCSANAATLGSAGTAQILRDFPNAEFPSTWYPVALANKRAGSDQRPASNDVNANFNSNIGTPGCFENSGWYYGLDTNHPANRVNLVAVVLHELAHGLGFQQFADTSTGEQNDNLSDVYGRHLFDVTQNRFWYEMTNAQRVQSAINTNNVVWTGAAVAAAAPTVLAGTPTLQITAPPAVAGPYTIGTAAFGPPLSSTVISGNLLLALDASDVVGPSTTDGCTAITNAGALAGKIAVVDRGDCLFVEKAKNVQDAGAIALVVVNNVAGSTPPGMAGDDPTVTISTVSVTQAEGNAIKAQLAVPATVSGFLTLNLNKLAGADSQGRMLLYTPNPLEPGSSIAHWDTSAFPNQLMEPNASDDLTHSVKAPQDLTLALMRDIGWTANAAGSFSPNAVAFGERLMGHGSFSHNVSFSNSGGALLTIASVVVSGSGAFSRTHDCPGGLAPAASCTVTVVYNPSAATLQSATLTITTNAPGSPHTVALTGTGLADLAFSLTRPRRPLRNASSGNTFDLTITPGGGFTGAVSLSCVGEDASVSCSVQPRTVTIANAPVSVAVVVKVAGRSQRLRRLPVTETRVIKVTAVVGGIPRTVELPVQIER